MQKIIEIVVGYLLESLQISQTKEVKNKMAHFQQTTKDSTDLICDKLPIALNKADLKRIKEEIMTRIAIHTGLKDAVKDIEV